MLINYNAKIQAGLIELPEERISRIKDATRIVIIPTICFEYNRPPCFAYKYKIWFRFWLWIIGIGLKENRKESGPLQWRLTQ